MAKLADYQNEIYLNGLAGQVPELPADLTKLEALAEGKLPAEAFAYVAGSAGTEDTARANREAFRRWRIVPRMLRDVSSVDVSVELFGTRFASPVVLGPIGVLSIMHSEGELAVARAAAAAGVAMVLSTAASHSIEEVAEASGDGARWFQLYWPKSRDLAASLLARAKASGYSVLVVTLDTTTLAWRPRDLVGAYLPFLRGIGVANYFSDPVFQAALAKPVEEDPDAAVMHWAANFSNPSLTWDDLAWLRECWAGPIVLKGIQHPDDAREAVARGVDGIVVSNHGGRQVDGAVASLDALPAIVDAVGDQTTVLFDSGIRSGADVYKAMALGAKGVLVARPYAYGLALGGESGVRHVVRSLLAELELTCTLTGTPRLDGLSRSVLTRGGRGNKLHGREASAGS